MSKQTATDANGRFDVMALAKTLPEQASTMIADVYLKDKETASCRIFRVYKPVPAHFHRTCDEFLYVLAGRGRFWMGSAAEEADFGPGELLVFDRETPHCIPHIFEEPLYVLAIDAPRRAPTDIVFVDEADGTPATFMARNAESA